MAGKVRDFMTKNPIMLDVKATAADAASLMKTRDVGDVLVVQDGVLRGIVTDRDLVVRFLAERADDQTSRLEDICSTKLATLAPDAAIDEAIQMMQDRAVRRVPVVEDGVPVGIISLGDLARARDPSSTLGKISNANPNR